MHLGMRVFVRSKGRLASASRCIGDTYANQHGSASNADSHTDAAFDRHADTDADAVPQPYNRPSRLVADWRTVGASDGRPMRSADLPDADFS